jgi:hypothetical protein
MSATGLRHEMGAHLGRPVEESEAVEYREAFFELYPQIRLRQQLREGRIALAHCGGKVGAATAYDFRTFQSGSSAAPARRSRYVGIPRASA